MQWYFRIRAAPRTKMCSRIFQILETQLIQPSEFRLAAVEHTLDISFTILGPASKAERIGRLLQRSQLIWSVVWLEQPEIKSLASLDQMAISSYARSELDSEELDPNSPFWQRATSVRMVSDPYGSRLRGHDTEVRLRWTADNLYFLFLCNYEELNLRTISPEIKQPTAQLWNWDVAEIFIAPSKAPLHSYYEFEVSPQSEWINLAIVSSNDTMMKTYLTSNSTSVGRIDYEARQWSAAFRITHTIFGNNKLQHGDEFRINFFRSQGCKPVELAWRPTYNESFHVPACFGVLVLAGQDERCDGEASLP